MIRNTNATARAEIMRGDRALVGVVPSSDFVGSMCAVKLYKSEGSTKKYI